jgi:hypothetical protein
MQVYQKNVVGAGGLGTNLCLDLVFRMDLKIQLEIHFELLMIRFYLAPVGDVSHKPIFFKFVPS